MSAAGKKPYVVHLSGDFPDPFVGAKTPVIQSLIDLTADAFAHRVISINRLSPPVGETAKELLSPRALETDRREFPYGIALRYQAPGRGILHRAKLEQLGARIAEEIAAVMPLPDLLVGHKLTIEGIAVSEAARRLGLPYALSIQGNTDLKILSMRPDLRPLFARIYNAAEVVFPFTPWALRGVEDRLGKRMGSTHLLPCPTDLDQPTLPVAAGNGLISVFHLRNYRLKNVPGIVQAYRRIEQTGGALPPLEIVGGGSDEDYAACRRLVGRFPQIRLVGALGRQEVRTRMNRASALVLPSLRESFGLVFIEALFAGVPIIYPKNAAVDGYFDNQPFALRVDPKSPQSIAEAMRHAIDNEAELKAALRGWQGSPAASLFSRDTIAETFCSGLRAALS